MGALAVLGPDAVLTTELRLTPTGDLAVVGGGDATLTARCAHSVDTLSALARAGGLARGSRNARRPPAANPGRDLTRIPGLPVGARRRRRRATLT